MMILSKYGIRVTHNSRNSRMLLPSPSFSRPLPPRSHAQLTLLSENIPAYTLIATQTPPAIPGSKSPDFTAIILTLIRLESESTDILVTINVPHIKGEYTEEEVDMQMGKQGKLIESAVEHAAKIWETFKIKDWGLFNEV